MPSPLWADTFGSGENAFDIEFVAVPSVGTFDVRPCGRCPIETRPGNRPDTSTTVNGVGSVPYDYRIGKFEISEAIIDAANVLGDLRITHDNRGPNKPATSIDWFEAARFVNWLNLERGFASAYKLDSTDRIQLWQPEDDGFNPANQIRNSHARYFLPSIDEWHKAAYYDIATDDYNQFPTGSSSPSPVSSGTIENSAVFQQGSVGPADAISAGGLSPYGTMAQGGNVFEWQDSPSIRFAGGYWDSALISLFASSNGGGGAANPSTSDDRVGFRVAFVPEPTSGVLSLMVVVLRLSLRREVK
ncbi:MAG: SUMF1/EgtB/PvdO family nonheme iron enzyme [Planctomycetota bacterium]